VLKPTLPGHLSNGDNLQKSDEKSGKKGERGGHPPRGHTELTKENFNNFSQDILNHERFLPP
jgi:hypothetical protein